MKTSEEKRKEVAELIVKVENDRLWDIADYFLSIDSPNSGIIFSLLMINKTLEKILETVKEQRA